MASCYNALLRFDEEEEVLKKLIAINPQDETTLLRLLDRHTKQLFHPRMEVRQRSLQEAISTVNNLLALPAITNFKNMVSLPKAKMYFLSAVSKEQFLEFFNEQCQLNPEEWTLEKQVACLLENFMPEEALKRCEAAMKM